MMKFSAPRIRIPRPRKRVVIISIVAILVIALGVYGFISYTTWRDLDQESKQVSNSLKTAVNEALGAEREDISPAAEMKKLVSDFDKKYSEAPCHVSPFMNWQTIVPQVKTIVSECEARFDNALTVIASLKPLITFIEHEKKANELFMAAVETTKAPSDYNAASATWKTLADSAELTDTGEFQLVGAKIKEVAGAISTAYASIATAMKDENKTALDDGIKNLEASYASASEIATVTTAHRQPLIIAIAAAYDAL